jgi:cell division protein FtsW
MIKKLFHHYDFTIILTTLLLTAFGLIMVYSSSSIWAVVSLGKSSSYFFVRQLMWTIIALIVGIMGMIIPYKMYKSMIKPMTIIAFLSLIVVFLFGTVSNGAKSWLNFGPVSIQPAEFTKLVIIMYLASVFSNKQNDLNNFKKSIIPPLVMVSIFFVMIAAEPALGSAMVFAGIAGCVILCSGMRFKPIALLFGSTGTIVAIMFRFLISGNQSARFTAAYHPFSVMSGSGWQLINSYIAMASGGLIGKGLGNSIEKAGYLPEPYTDFIMAIVAEELGVMGVTFVIICIFYLVVRGILIGMKCTDVFGSLLAIGISSFIGIESLVNLGAVSGLLPVTGVTLPFVSYGGSSLVILMFSMGILINISSFVKMNEKKANNEQTQSIYGIK